MAWVGLGEAASLSPLHDEECRKDRSYLLWLKLRSIIIGVQDFHYGLCCGGRAVSIHVCGLDSQCVLRDFLGRKEKRKPIVSPVRVDTSLGNSKLPWGMEVKEAVLPFTVSPFLGPPLSHFQGAGKFCTIVCACGGEGGSGEQQGWRVSSPNSSPVLSQGSPGMSNPQLPHTGTWRNDLGEDIH